MSTRREFITLLGGTTVWPVAARAQQPALPVIGFMSPRSPEDSVPLVAAFRQGLGETGFVEGQNIAIEFRWARGQYDLLPALAAELVRRRVAVLAAGGDPSALAADASYLDNPGCVWDRQRSNQGRPGRKPQSPRQERNRVYPVDQ